MTYEEILREVRALPEELKRRLMDEIENDWIHADESAFAEADARWDSLFEKSQDVLSAMADEVRAEHRRGEITELTDEDFA